MLNHRKGKLKVFDKRWCFKRLSWQPCQSCSNSLPCQVSHLQAALFKCSGGWMLHLAPVLLFLQIRMSLEGNLCHIGHALLTCLAMGSSRWEKTCNLKGGQWSLPMSQTQDVYKCYLMKTFPYPLPHQHPSQDADLPCNPTRLCLCRAAVLFLVFWPNSSIHGGLLAVLVKFQSAAYATSAYYICFCALWKCCCFYYYYYYYYYALEVWVRSKSLLGAVLCTSYTEKCCLPARASTHLCPCRALCSLAKSWLQFRQKMSYATFQRWNCYFLTTETEKVWEIRKT